MKKQSRNQQTLHSSRRLAYLWQKLCLALCLLFSVLIIIGSVGLHLCSSNFTTNSALTSSSMSASSYLRILLWLMPDSVESDGRVYYVEAAPEQETSDEENTLLFVFNGLQFYYYDDTSGTQQKVIVGADGGSSTQKLGVAFLFIRGITDTINTLKTIFRVVIGVSAGGLVVTVVFAGCKEYARIEKEKAARHHTPHRARQKRK